MSKTGLLDTSDRRLDHLSITIRELVGCCTNVYHQFQPYHILYCILRGHTYSLPWLVFKTESAMSWHNQKKNPKLLASNQQLLLHNSGI